MTAAAQQELQFRTWGGRRRGAGRRPATVGRRARRRHAKRPLLRARFPVHVTWRMRRDVLAAQHARCFSGLARAFWGGCDRFEFRLVHYSVQGNHMHLLVEAHDEKSLARGMNGLGVRVARQLNRASWAVTATCSTSAITRTSCSTPTEVRNARSYLLTNARKHLRLDGEDPYASKCRWWRR